MVTVVIFGSTADFVFGIYAFLSVVTVVGLSFPAIRIPIRNSLCQGCEQRGTEVDGICIPHVLCFRLADV